MTRKVEAAIHTGGGATIAVKVAGSGASAKSAAAFLDRVDHAAMAARLTLERRTAQATVRANGISATLAT